MEFINCMKCDESISREKIINVGSVIILGELPKAGYCPDCFTKSFDDYLRNL